MIPAIRLLCNNTCGYLLKETCWTEPEEVAVARAKAEAEKRKADEEARQAAAQKRAVMQAQADAQLAHHRNLQQWGSGPRGGASRPPFLAHPMMAAGGGRGGQYQQMMAFMAQKQEKLRMQQSREELSARFKEMLMDFGVTAYSRWEKELPKLQGDDRFKAVPTAKERRILFDHFCCNITSELVSITIFGLKMGCAFILIFK